MTNINFLDFWTFFAGLGFFLFGMNSIERILKNSSGRSFKLFLKRNTRNLFKSILGGTLVTALVQSSSVVSLLVLTFVEARILSFRNAMGVILGANLGTTLTSWIVATVGFKFDLISYCLPVIAISALGQFFSENRKKLNNFFSILFALGVVFLGLSYIKEGADYLVNHFDLRPYLQYGPIVFVGIGFLLTTIIQSSSTTVAITLAAIHSGLLDFPTGAAVVIGSEVGTTMKVLLWGIQGSPDKKRVGWGTFIYNIFTAIFAFFLLDWIIEFITQFLPYDDPLIRLVFFQSFINVLSILLFLPLLPFLSKWLEGKFKAGEEQHGSYISPNLPNVPLLAVDALKREAQNMLEKVLHYIGKVLDRGQSGPKGRVGSIRSLSAIEHELQITYQRIKHTEGDLLEYYTHLPLNQFSKNESGMLLNYIHAVRHCVYSAKAIKDILHNLDEFDNSENDLVHGAGLVIRRDWLTFESQFKKLLGKTPDETMEADVVELLVQVRGYERKQKSRLLERLKADQINEMETSTLMNVNREIMSCKKSLIKAFMDIHNQFLSLDDDIELMD